MFKTFPTFARYRAIKDRTPLPMMKGEDVYALQKGLNSVLEKTLKTDGSAGPKTGATIWEAQRALEGLVEDGKAGQQTQRAIVLAILSSHLEQQEELFALTQGQLEHESSYWLGNYSEQRPNGSYDAGVAQRNTEHTDPRQGFDPVLSIAALLENTRNAYARYEDKSRFRGDDFSENRRWKLAAGAWNAPAYANYFAGVGNAATPGPTAAALFEEYMADVAVYLA